MSTTTSTEPARGAEVTFALKDNGTATGTVTSAYTAGGKLRVSIRAGGTRYTRTASTVTVTRPAPPETEQPAPRSFGQTPGQPAPNAGKKYPAEPLTPAEFQSLLDQCSRRAPTGIRNRALLTLLYRSGLRISEILALHPKDVNLDKHSIRLLRTKSGEPQTRGFHAGADDALMRWLDKRSALGFRDGPLFCTLDDGPVSGDYVRGLLRRLAARAGVEKRVHPHGLRHTFACELEQSGLTVTEISKLLGHSSVAITALYLNHMTSHQAIEALQSVDLPPLS